MKKQEESGKKGKKQKKRLIPACTSLFQHITAYISVLQTNKAISSIFRPIPAHTSLFQPKIRKLQKVQKIKKLQKVQKIQKLQKLQKLQKGQKEQETKKENLYFFWKILKSKFLLNIVPQISMEVGPMVKNIENCATTPLRHPVRAN